MMSPLSCLLFLSRDISEEHLITVFQYLKGSDKEDRGSLFIETTQRRQGTTGTNCTRRDFVLI